MLCIAPGQGIGAPGHISSGTILKHIMFTNAAHRKAGYGVDEYNPECSLTIALLLRFLLGKVFLEMVDLLGGSKFTYFRTPEYRYDRRPGRRIIDDDRLQRLLQPSEIVGK